MQERGVSRELVLQILRNTIPFSYFHGGSIRLGYYESSRKIFVSVANDTVITVVAHVSEGYIERLRKKAL